MKRTLHGLSKRTYNKNNTNILYNIQCRASTAFDPWHYLHKDTVRKEQAQSFRKVWKNDIGDFKKSLSPQEIQLFEDKVAKSESFEEFYAKMKELFSPRRHHAIKTTKTWEFTQTQMIKYLNTDSNALISIIFDDDETFTNEFRNKYLLSEIEGKDDGLLSMFPLSDLRFMSSCIAIDIYSNGKTTITPIFGCRNNYHFNIPDPNGHSAHWLSCLYANKTTLYDIVLISVLNAIKENKPINQLYFKDKLQSLEQNALKEDEWREYAQEFMAMDTDTFNDRLDRAFVAFQTDDGVSELKPRFDTDID
mmetsp:Transcript_5786/g.5062  ORF Transcript_5786/g.5062 Transcript_5786/m.5062 type:complete len:306 (+) Transcript_5786:18-935(+)